MKITYSPDSEHLLDVFSSAVWHYRQYTEEIINSACPVGSADSLGSTGSSCFGRWPENGDWNYIDLLLSERKIINEVVKGAVENPIPGDGFKIICKNCYENFLVRQVLEHYLAETINILNNINEPLISGKCREDVEIIQKYIMHAVH